MTDGPSRKPPQRTVIGGAPMPGAPGATRGGPGDDPFQVRPMPGAGTPPGGGAQRTVIGGMPPAGGTDIGHPGGANPFASPADAANPFASAPSPGQGRAWMGAQAPADSFFPEMARPEPLRQSAPTQKIPLEDALRARTDGFGAGGNPLVAAAAGLLVLFGRLRSQVVDMEAMPLMTHVTQELESYERRAIEAGADPQDALIGKYALCGTADDIVQNLPGADRHVWVQYSMVARFFNRRTSGVGFFQQVEKALADPVRKYGLLELMLTCLNLGFEGQYRTMPGGDVELQRVRRQIFETLRRVKPRGDDDISPHWQGQEIAARRHGARLPVWASAALALAVLGGSYFGLRMFLIEDGRAVAESMRLAHPTQGIKIAHSPVPDRNSVAAVFIQPVEYVPPPVPETTQLERIRAALATEIEDGLLSVENRGVYIAITANNLILFDSGRSDVKDSFAEVAGRVAQVLEEETGDIRIVGHTDSVPLSGRGRFKNNQELSVARADSVAGVIRSLISEPERIAVDGMGADEPVADNATAEGRAANRRVEFLIGREDARAEDRF